MQPRVIMALTALLLAAGVVQADVFNMGGTRDPATGHWTGLASLETVPVGDAGNASDIHGEGYGSVGYNYNIGKYEVTAGQYTAFLNAVGRADTYGLYNEWMLSTAPGCCKIQRTGSSGSYTYSVASKYANRPVNYVSYWDSCRFANWLNNGQPTGAQSAGTTETGAYNLNGYNGYDGRTIQRSADAKWAVTSEGEWYKAAYYKGGGTNADYWNYPTSSDGAPGQDMNEVTNPGNNANYYTTPYTWPIDSGKAMTVVGEFELSDSPYGTFDQGGNVREWNEAIILFDPEYNDDADDYSCRGMRGGSFIESLDSTDAMNASNGWGDGYYPNTEGSDFGFRVSEVPEPASMALLALGGIGMLLRRRFGFAHRERGLRR